MSSSTRTLWYALAAVSVLVCLSMSTRPSSAARAAQSERLSLRVDVELVTVEVIVLDKKGVPIRNLKKEDFELFEEGKRQEIVTFAEVNDEQNVEVPTSLADLEDSGINRGKVVLILFDDSHITSSKMIVARESAEKYVKEQMRPQDLFAVATYGLSLKLLQNFTHDSGKVMDAIRQPAASFSTTGVMAGMRGATNSAGDATMGRQPGGRSVQAAQSPELRLRLTSLFRALNAVSSSVGVVRGRKAVLIFSEDFSATTDIQSEFTSTIDSAKRANVAFYTVDVKGLSAGPIGEISPHRENPGRPAGAALRAAYSPVRSLFGRLSLPSALPMVSSFQQSGGGQGGGQSGGQGSGGSGGSGGAAGSGGAGGAAPPAAGGSGGGAAGGNASPGGVTGGNTPGGNTGASRGNSTGSDIGRRDQADLAPFVQPTMENLLRSLATETGGVAVFNTSDFNTRLNEVTRELNNYYVLGFQSNNPKRDGKFRRLKVKTEVKKGDLRYRDGYIDPRPLDALAGSKGEKSMLRAIASPTPAVLLPVSFKAFYFYDSPGLARVPVSARIRTDSVELKKKGGQLAGDVDVMGVAYGEDGAVSARFSETLHVAIDKESEVAFRRQGLSYQNHFRLRPGKYQLKFAVADEKGKVGSVEQSLVVPPQNTGELAASSLVVIEQASRLPALIQDLQMKLFEDNDPLIYKGLQMVPSIENQLEASKPVSVAFKIYNLSGAAEQPEQLRLVAEPVLIGENGAKHAVPPFALDSKHLFPTGSKETMVALSLAFKDVAPGKYKLVLAASEGATSRSVTLQADVQLR